MVFTPLQFPQRGTETFLTVKEGSTFLSKPLFPQGREDVAGDAIALPEFWYRQRSLCPKGLPMIVYAIELRLFVGWRIENISYENAYYKILFIVLWVEGLPMGIPYCSFSPFLVPHCSIALHLSPLE